MKTVKNVVGATVILGAFNAFAHAQDDPFRAVRERYRQIKSIHLAASADVVRRPDLGAAETVNGGLRMEYWADPQGYRMTCTSDRSLDLVDDMELAFYGGQWQLLQVPKREIVLYTQRRGNPLACPNPLFLMIEFAGPPRRGCEGCSLSLQDLWNAEVRDVRTMRSGSRYQSSVDYRIRDQQSVPPQDYQLTIQRQNGAAVPVGLVRFYPSGRPQAEFRASRFIPTSVGLLPSRIVMRSFEDADQKQAIDVITYNVDSIEVNKPIDYKHFLVDWSAADMVYDSDGGEYIIHPDRDMTNERLRRFRASQEAAPVP